LPHSRFSVASSFSLSGCNSSSVAPLHLRSFLAKPRILVNDKTTGTISTKDTTYVETTGRVLPMEGSVTVQTSTKYDPYDAGIILDIMPHINEGKLLRLKINLHRSDFTSSFGDSPPDATSNDINTVVTVPDKSTIILGGMLKLNENRSSSKVPILGDIPLLGALFRSTANSNVQKNLYVFVKAQIVRPTDMLAGESDLRRVSDRYRTAFENHEAEFHGYQSWPGVNAKPMRPVKVLDEQ